MAVTIGNLARSQARLPVAIWLPGTTVALVPIDFDGGLGQVPPVARRSRRRTSARSPSAWRFLGGAWTPNIIWYLREGPRRFNELRRDMRGVSGKMLSQRLQRLQADGMVAAPSCPTSPPTVEYELTDLGIEVLPAVDAIVEVGHRLKARRDAA